MTLQSGSVFRSQWQRYLRVLNGPTRSGSKLYRKKSPRRWVVFCCDNLVCPKPYTIIAPETKTTNPIEKTHKIKKEQTMKTGYKIAVWLVITVAGAIITRTNPL